MLFRSSEALLQLEEFCVSSVNTGFVSRMPKAGTAPSQVLPDVGDFRLDTITKTRRWVPWDHRAWRLFESALAENQGNGCVTYLEVFEEYQRLWSGDLSRLKP